MTAPPRQPLGVELHLPHEPADIQVQFRVVPGQILALLAQGDAAASAVLEALAGLRAVKKGRITLGSQVLLETAVRRALPPEKRRLAWVDGQALAPGHLTLQQQLALGAKLASNRVPRPQDAVLAMAEEVGLPRVLLSQRSSACSPAQSLRLALGRALLSQPQALLLHHPLAAVPETDRPALLDLLMAMRLRHRVPVVLVTDRIGDAARLADEVLVMHEGRLAALGPTCQVLSDVSMSSFLEGEQAGTLLDAEVKRHDLEWLLSEVEVAGQWLTVPALLQDEGRRVRLKIRARDVHVHLTPRDDGASSNQLRGRVGQVMLAGQHGSHGAVTVHLTGLRQRPVHGLRDEALQHHSGTLWSLMTRRSIEQMGLAPGQDCYVSFKAMAVTVLARH